MAMIMALLSTAMLGAPFSIGMAFWIPTTMGAIASVEYTLPQFDTYMSAAFGGYVLFTFFAIVFINRTLLERFLIKSRLNRQAGTVRLLLRDYEDNAADWLWELDAFLRLKSVSPRFAQAAGTAIAALEGQHIADVLDPGGADGTRSHAVRTALIERKAFHDLSVKVDVGGQTRWWSVTGHPVTDDEGNFRGYHGVGSDVTEAKRSEHIAAYLATHDSLTGIGNRRMFLERLEEACRCDEREAEKLRPFTLMLMDLDRFKEVNDEHGHAVGDAVLVAVAEALREALREGDTVARLGGDEFAILLGSGNHDEATLVAERLVATLGKGVNVGGIWLGIGASLGLASFPVDGTTPLGMLRNVDLALYRAKDEGKGTYRVFDPSLGEEFRARATMQADLRDAVQEKSIHVEYQPIIDLATGRIVSVEALARWTHPILGSVAPETFIRMAEESGLIGKLGETVLHEACLAAMQWREPVAVSVNLSPVQFRDPGLAEAIRTALLRTGLAANRLELEVTESAWLAVDPSTRSQLAEMQTLGVRLVMDDFGTGFSALAALREFSFQGLKVDSGFVRDIERDEKARTIVCAVANLARDLGITLTAEGVETPGQLSIVRACGIDRAQGFLLGKPSCGKDLINTMANLTVGSSTPHRAEPGMTDGVLTATP